MNSIRIAIFVVALGIALCGAILTAAAIQPPIYPVPGIIVLFAFIGNVVFAAAQTQLNGWRDATPERQLLLRLAQDRANEGQDPVRLLQPGHPVANPEVPRHPQEGGDFAV